MSVSLRAEETGAGGQSLAEARALVQQLASSSFARRQAAAQQLASLGFKARPALIEGLKSPHAEARLQAERILSVIEQNDFEQSLEDFIADASGLKDHRLPGWKRFRQVVGEDLAARKMFVSLLRAETDLVTAVDNDPRAAAGLFLLRAQQLQVDSAANEQEIDAANLAALLFVASDERVPLPANCESLLYQFCSHRGIRESLDAENKGANPIMRKLVGGWIGAGRGGYYTLRLAMAYDLKEGLTAAEKILDGNGPSYYKQYAILTIAKLGSKQHIPFLLKLLDDASVCSSHRVNNVSYETQFRDIALVAILHVLGEDPKEFGFDRIRANSQYVYSSYTIGFETDEQRKAVFDKWDSYYKKIEKEIPKEAPAERKEAPAEK